MIRGPIRALRFAAGWKKRHGPLLEEETEVDRGDRTVPATLFRPGRGGAPWPGWVILHGITRPGRHHPMLLRFARAVAGSGAAVLIPEIPEWRELHLAPEAVLATIRASVLALDDRRETAAGRIGVIGFSFGAPQALVASADPSLAGHLRRVVGFGGYCDLDRTLPFLFHGEHEWGGKRYRVDPDPYGRWVVGGNYLTRVPEHEGAGDVAAALLELARFAGDQQVGAWEVVFDEVKSRLEEEIHPGRRPLFRLFAPPAGELPPREEAVALARALAQAVRESNPLAEPGSSLGSVGVPVRLLHGRGDRLIPFSETLLLRERFPPGADVRVYLTGLFAHSQRGGTDGVLSGVVEKVRLLRALADVLGGL